MHYLYFQLCPQSSGELRPRDKLTQDVRKGPAHMRSVTVTEGENGKVSR